MAESLNSMREMTIKAKKIADKHSPNVDKMVSIKVDTRTTIYVTQNKYNKYGEQHFISKYHGRGSTHHPKVAN